MNDQMGRVRGKTLLLRARLFFNAVQRHGNIAQIGRIARVERQHVRRSVFGAELPIQSTKAGIVSKKNGDALACLQAGGLLQRRARRTADQLERCLILAPAFVFDDERDAWDSLVFHSRSSLGRETRVRLTTGSWAL